MIERPVFLINFVARARLKGKSWSARDKGKEGRREAEDGWMERPARASITSDTSAGCSYEFFLIAGPAVSITSHPLRPSTTHRSIHFGYKQPGPPIFLSLSLSLASVVLDIPAGLRRLTGGPRFARFLDFNLRPVPRRTRCTTDELLCTARCRTTSATGDGKMFYPQFGSRNTYTNRHHDYYVTNYQ